MTVGVSLMSLKYFCIYNVFKFDFVFATSATQEHVDVEDANESVSVEVGYISNVHGLQGEVRVKPSTDFPELRFSKVK